jgi:putative oxidoreductase
MLERMFVPDASVGVLILRLALGIVFLPHGLSKLKNPGELAGLLKTLGVPAPALFAWLVALLESVGAALLIVGLATRVVAVGLAIDMVVAIGSVRIRMMKAPFTSTQQAQGWEFEFALMAMALALVFTGAGRVALDRLIGL